jgi:DNA end-binding protein Ku
MTARAIWKGELKLDSTKVPVKLYSAVKDQAVRFHILDQKSKTRVKQHMVEPGGKEVTTEDVRKGFEVETGTFVILEKEELEKLAPEESREIKIIQFVPPEEIPPEYYDRPYYLGPDGDQTAYFALAEALKNQEKEAVARWDHAQTVLRWRAARGRRSSVVVYSASRRKKFCQRRTCRIRPGAAPDKKELTMAKQLVEMLKGEFDPKDYKDEYRERVMEFVEKKAKGHKPRLHLVKDEKKDNITG